MRPVHIVPIRSLADLAAILDRLDPDDSDLVLSHPAQAALVVGAPSEIAAAYEVFGEAVAVAAAPEALSAGREGARLTEALVEQLGALPYRAHPHPLGLCGPAGTLRKLLASLPAGTDDTERLAAALLGGGGDLALDTGGQVFRVLDGSGADVVAVAGRLHAGNERPVVMIDPTDGRRLEALAAGLADPGARDLAALLRYEGAAADGGDVVEAASEILVMPFWTGGFCASVIRAAETAAVWTADPEDPVPGSEVSLFTLSPRLVGLLEEDLVTRIWPRWRRHWTEAAVTAIHDAFVIRYEPGPSQGLPLHHDVAQVSCTVKLNDAYEGGALAFPRQGWDTGRVPVGQLVAWPSLVTHPHRAEPVTRGVKYGLTIWLRLPDE